MVSCGNFILKYDREYPEACFGIQKLQERLRGAGMDHLLDSISVEVGQGEPESFILEKKDGIILSGSDGKAIMYGAFELAEKLLAGEDFGLIKKSPAVKTRGIHQFIHNKECDKDWYYSKDFWDGYFDMLAENRYNSFNLVFSHQTYYLAPIYAYLFKTEGFKVTPTDAGEDEIKKNYDMLQYITEKAEKRGIDFIIGVWEVLSWRHGGGQKQVVDGITDENIIPYSYASFKKLFREFPHIKGIQVRVNEESGIRREFQTEFWTNTLFKAINESDRKIILDYRGWAANPETSANAVALCPGMRVSVKYWGEFMGAPYQPAKIVPGYSYGDYLKKPMPYDFLWQVWNLGNPRLLLWGDSSYVRRFVDSLPLGGGSGFEVSPQLAQKGYGNISGGFRILKHKEDEYYEYEYERYWMFYQMFGRISYDPQIPDSHFRNKLEDRVGAAAAAQVLAAYQKCSRVMNFMIQYSLSDLNMYTWPEIDTGGLLDYYLDTPTSDQCTISNIFEYAQQYIKNEPSGKWSPDRASRYYDGLSGELLELCAHIEKIPASSGSKELKSSLVDFKVLAYLAKYHSGKIQAAKHLAFYYLTRDYGSLLKAEKYLTEATPYFEQIISITQDYYHEDMVFAPIDNGHWKKGLTLVYEDELRLKAMKDVFNKYKLFEKGFDFGGQMGRSPVDNTDYNILRDYPIEKGFNGVSGGLQYTKEKGYGFVNTDGVKTVSSPLVRLSDRHIDDVKRDSLGKLNNNMRKGYRMPLYEDCVTGTSPAEFKADVEDGEYAVTIILCDRSVNAKSYGPMTVEAGGEIFFKDAVLPHMAVMEETRRVTAAGGCLKLRISCAEGCGWVLGGVIIYKEKPYIAHLPAKYFIGAPSEITVSATSVTGVKEVVLVLNDTDKIIMTEKSENIYVARIPADTTSARYCFIATDCGGNTAQSETYFLKKADAEGCFTLKHTPAPYAKPAADLAVELEAESANPIRKVLLHYSHTNQKEPVETLEMTFDGQKYTGAIPAGYVIPEWDILYYFEILDAFDYGIIYPEFLNERPYYVTEVKEL